MDIQKLRIGNLASDAKGNICVVAKLYGENAYFDYHDKKIQSKPPEQLSPIILNTDWVVKLGFTKKNKATYVKEGYVYKTSSLQTMWCVHHLQNDYFFKTGNELILNL